jgi:LAO/AO transport system kinase
VLTSSRENKGIDELWKLLVEYKGIMLEKDEFYEKRQAQVRSWFWTHLKENLLEVLLSKPAVRARLDELETQVVLGSLTPGQASDALIADVQNVFKI